MDNQTREFANQQITLPHDVVPLPSGGLFYKNKKKSVKVGYLTAFDENILLGGGEDITYNLLKNKIYEPDIKVEDMLEGDVEAILIFLRNTSFGPQMTFKSTDPITKKIFTSEILLDQLRIIKGVDPSEDGTFSTVLPVSGYSVKLKPSTYGESLQLQKRIDSYPAGRIIPRVTWKLEMQIQEINGTDNKGDIAKIVETLPIGDSKFIKKFLDENEPRLDMSKTIIAPSGEKLTVNVGFGVDFFRPFLGL
jgi:hypothetical protein